MKKVNAVLTAAALCCTALPIMPLGITANAAGADALSYAAFDTSVSTTPAWLSGWKKTPSPQKAARA